MSQIEGSSSGERQELEVVSKRIKPNAHSGLVFIMLKGRRYELNGIGWWKFWYFHTLMGVLGNYALSFLSQNVYWHLVYLYLQSS